MSKRPSPGPLHATQEVVVRVVEPREVAAVQSLVAEHARYERRQQPLPRDWAARASQLVATGKLMLFVPEREARPIGYAALTRETSTWSATSYAHLDCLFVSSQERGVGVGRLLFEAVAATARDRGDGELQWQTPAWNDGAVRFYDRLEGSSDLKRRYTVDLHP